MKTSYHCVYDLNYHLVLATKRRRRLLTPSLLDVVETSMRERVAAAGGALTEFGGEADHVHALIALPPKAQLTVLVNAIKTNSSRRLRAASPELLRGGPAFWSPSYFIASCGGAPLERIREYVRAQERPD